MSFFILFTSKITPLKINIFVCSYIPSKKMVKISVFMIRNTLNKRYFQNIQKKLNYFQKKRGFFEKM